MATFYISRISRQQYPNIFRNYDTHHRVPVNHLFDANYVNRKEKITPLGSFNSKTAAINECKRYAKGQLGTSTIEFKYLKDGRAAR